MPTSISTELNNACEESNDVDIPLQLKIILFFIKELSIFIICHFNHLAKLGYKGAHAKNN